MRSPTLDAELTVHATLGHLDGAPGIWRRSRGGWRLPANAALLVPPGADLTIKGELASPLLPVDPEQVAVWLARSELRDIDTWRTWVREYQRDSVCRLAARQGGALWQPAGAGKTIQCNLVALAGEEVSANPWPVVLVTRAKAREQHRRELIRFFDIDPYMLIPRADWRVSRLGPYKDLFEYLEQQHARGRRPWVICSWEALPNTPHLADALELFGPITVIFDEIHRGKDYRRRSFSKSTDASGEDVWTARERDGVSNAAAHLAERCLRRFGATASALADRPEDLWGQLALIEPAGWGATAGAYRKRYAGGYIDENGYFTTRGAAPTHTDELKARLSMCVVEVPYAVTHAGLPEWRRIIQWIPSSELSNELVVKGEPSFARQIRDCAKEAGSTREAQSRLEWLYRAQAASRKRVPVVDLVLNEALQLGAGKVIIYTGLRRDCEYLHNAFVRRSKGAVTAWWADGSVSENARQDIQDAYMAHPGPAVLIGTWQAWGESLNLQDTDAIVWAMTPNTPREVEQGEGRARRHGMTRKLVIYYVIGEGLAIVQRACDRLIAKLPAVELVQTASTTLAGMAGLLDGAGQEDRWIAEMLRDLDAAEED